MLLDNGVTIAIRDFTKVYFGDYFLVWLEVTCQAPDAGLACAAETSATAAQGAVFRRVLKKMGVPSAEIETAKETLVRDFLDNSLAYISSADFPAKLASSALLKPAKVSHKYAESKF